MNTNEEVISNPTKLAKHYLGNANVGDLIVYTLNDGESFEIGMVTEKKYSEFWGTDLVLVDDYLIFFKFDGSHHGGTDREYAVEVVEQWRLKFTVLPK